VVNLAYFGETYTDNIRIHGGNYTVMEATHVFEMLSLPSV
jgi:hypothetical protein